MAKKKTKPAKKPAEPDKPAASAVAPGAPMCPMVTATHETVHRSQIKEAAYNPRGMNDEERRLLSNSLKKFGLVNYLVWNKRNGNLVGGHQRLAELDKRMGTQDYRMNVNVVDLDDRNERNLNVVLNNPAVAGAFDLAKLGDLFLTKQLDPEDAGFTPAQLYQFFGDSPMVEQPEQLTVLAAQMREARERYEAIQKAAGQRDDVNYYLVVHASYEERDAFLADVGLAINRNVNGRELAAQFQKLRERVAELEAVAEVKPAGKKKAG